jgi:hypothetical protein
LQCRRFQLTDSGGVFAGVGELVVHVKTVNGLLIVLGLSIFEYGIVKGPFSWDNSLLTCGVMCFAASFAVKYLAKSRGWVYDGYRVVKWFEWGNVLAGSAHLAIFVALGHRLLAHRWLL